MKWVLAGLCAAIGLAGIAAWAQEPISTYRAAAMKRDYQAQRNVAFCLRTGDCPGITVPKPIEACAWRMVILGSGHTDVDASDVANHRRDCSAISADERFVARRQAEELFRSVYGKPLAN